MTLLAGEDYSRYFELPPSMQDLVPFKQGMSHEDQSDLLEFLKNKFAALYTPHKIQEASEGAARAGLNLKTIEKFSDSSSYQVPVDNDPLSRLKFHSLALTAELAAIQNIYEHSMQLLSYRQQYRQTCENERFGYDFLTIQAFDFTSFNSSSAMAFAYQFPHEKIPENPDPLLEKELHFALTHPDKEVSELAKLILASSRKITEKKLKSSRANINYLLALFPHLLDKANAMTLSQLEAQILIPQYNEYIAFDQAHTNKTYKLSYRLTSSTDDELQKRIQDIKQWSATLPGKIETYGTLWRELEREREKRKSQQERISFLKNYMAIPSGLEEDGKEILKPYYGGGFYKEAAHKFQANFENPPEVQQKKPQGKKGKKAGKSKKPQKNAPKVLQAKKLSPNKEISSQPFLSKESAAKTNPFAQLSAPPLKHYSERVLTWIEDEIPFHLNTDSYNHLSPEKKAEQHRRHGFSLEVDKFIRDANYAKNTTWKNPTTMHEDKRIFIAGEMEYLGETQRGFFTFCYGQDGKIYHRHFTTVSTEELLKSSEQSTYAYDFPSLAEVAALSSDAMHRTGQRQGQRSEKAIPGDFGSVLIYDELHNTKITLFKRPA